MAAVNYAQEYSRALAQAYPYVLYFSELRATENNGRYKWLDGKTIQIPKITTTGRVAGNRDTIGSFSRNVDNDWEPKTLANHREWSTLVHPRDIDETNQALSIQNITQVFNEEKKFPEMDAYLISKIYSDWVTAGGTADTTALTNANILTVFDSLMVAMDEARVPSMGRILYCTPPTEALLKTATAIARNIDLKNPNEAVSRIIAKLDEVTIKKVPSELMKTAYDFTVGYAPAIGAKQINLMLVHPSAVITPEVYNFAGLEAPSAHSKGKYLYFEESEDDVFILNNKKGAIAFNKVA